MIYLKDNKYGSMRVAVLEPSNGKISWHSMEKDSNLATKYAQGHAARLAGQDVCLYRLDGILKFQFNRSVYAFTDDIQVKLERLEDNFNYFELSRQENVLFVWVYPRPELNLIEALWEVSDGITEEQEDFCAFVYNLANDLPRRKRIYQEPFRLTYNE